MEHIPRDVVCYLSENYLNYADAYMVSLTCKHLRSTVRAPPLGLMSLLRRIDGSDEWDTLFYTAGLLDEIVASGSTSQAKEALVYLAPHFTGVTSLAAAVSNNPSTLECILKEHRKLEDGGAWFSDLDCCGAQYAAGAGAIRCLEYLAGTLGLPKTCMEFVFRLDVAESFEYYCELFDIEDPLDKFYEEILSADAVKCFATAEAIRGVQDHVDHLVFSIDRALVEYGTDAPLILEYLSTMVDSIDISEVRDYAESVGSNNVIEWLDGRGEKQ